MVIIKYWLYSLCCTIYSCSLFFCFCFVFFLTFVLLIYFLTSYLWLFSLLRHPVCGWVLSSPCLLTRLSGSSGSWPRNKSRIVPFLNGFEWKLAIKSGTTPREDIGEEPSWVYKKQAGSIRSGLNMCGTHVKTTFLRSQITMRTSLL